MTYKINLYKGNYLHKEVSYEGCLSYMGYSYKKYWDGITKIEYRLYDADCSDLRDRFYSLHMDAFKPYKEYLEPYISSLGGFVFDPREISYRKLRTLFSIWRVPWESKWKSYTAKDLKGIPPEYRLLLFSSFYRDRDNNPFSTRYYFRGHAITTEEKINIKGKHSKVMEWLNDNGKFVAEVDCPAQDCNFNFNEGTTLADYTNPTLPMIAEEFYK